MAGFTRNQYYNDPNIGAAFQNLASMFAPPSAQDMAGYATAQATRDQNSRLSALFQAAGGDFDKMGAATGQWAPSQSYYAVDQSNATDRRGQDIDAATKKYTADQALAGTRYTADTGMRGDMFDTLYGALAPGEVRPAIPANEAAMFGLEEALGGVAGVPKPMTENEVLGQNLQQQLGSMTDDQLLGLALGGDTVMVNTPNGPVYANPGVAAAQGAPAFVNPGSAAGQDLMLFQNPATGESIRGTFNPATGQALDVYGQPVPAEYLPFKVPQTTGSAADTGLGKPTRNAIERQLIDINVAKNTAVGLRDLVAASPASQGVVGWLRGTAQNAGQVAQEVGAYFGGGVQEVMTDISSGLADEGLASNFDPNIPAIDMMANLLAFQYAKTTTGERLSNEMLRASKAALGLDKLTSNQADALARLNQAVAMIEQQESILNSAYTNGTASLGAPAPGMGAVTPMGPAGAGGPTPPAPPGPPAPANAPDNIPTVQTPEEAMRLPSGTQFRDPQGNIRVVP